MEWNPDLAWQPVPVHTVDHETDVLLNAQQTLCPKLNRLRQEVELGQIVQDQLAEHQLVL